MTGLTQDGFVRTLGAWPDQALQQHLARAGGPALEAARDEARTRLAEIDVELREWRSLAYNASQMRNARSFGRCQRNIDRLEAREAQLRKALAA